MALVTFHLQPISQINPGLSQVDGSDNLVVSLGNLKLISPSSGEPVGCVGRCSGTFSPCGGGGGSGRLVVAARETAVEVVVVTVVLMISAGAIAARVVVVVVVGGRLAQNPPKVFPASPLLITRLTNGPSRLLPARPSVNTRRYAQQNIT